jgi:hypothetical protein
MFQILIWTMPTATVQLSSRLHVEWHSGSLANKSCFLQMLKVTRKEVLLCSKTWVLRALKFNVGTFTMTVSRRPLYRSLKVEVLVPADAEQHETRYSVVSRLTSLACVPHSAYVTQADFRRLYGNRAAAVAASKH